MQEIVSWADTEIARSPSPDRALIDLALMRDRAQVLETLHRITVAADFERSTRLLCRFLYRALRDGKLSHGQVASSLYSVSRDGPEELPDDLWPMTTFEDYLELAEDGQWGSPQAIKDEIVVFLLAAMGDGPPDIPLGGD